MSRVDGERSSSGEAERVQKEADKRTREAKQEATDRQAFGKLLSGQKNAKDAASKQAQQQGQEKLKDAQQKGGEAARSALMARSGVASQGRVMEQAKSFQGALDGAKQQSAQADTGRVERRDAGKAKDKVESEDRKEVQESRAEAKKDKDAELARADARDAARPNAAIGSDNKGGGGDDKPPQDDGSAAAAAAIKKSQAPQAAQGAKAAQPVKQIPPELLEKLVSTVHLAVSAKGLKEFQIELKDGPLKGGFLKISADGGKVALSFSGLGANEANLLESSKGELMRRLAKKGLTLDKLDIKARA